jgi:pimeloyl-ACP methyl ester carboxylesterase
VPSARRFGRSSFVAIAAVVALAGSCATEPEPAAVRATLPGDGAGPTLTWKDCGRDLECSTLVVPLDWDDPDGPTTGIAVARRPADGPQASIGPLLTNPGGPGASGVEYLQAAGDLDGLGEHFDLVSWDPRGAGGDAGISCDADDFLVLDPGPDDAAEQAALDRAAGELADECVSSSPIVEHVATDQSIRDMDLLRSALGAEQISYLGFSYGTYLGQRYAEAFPERVRAMVLDGVVDPTQDLEGMLTGQATSLDRYLDDLFTACDLADECPLEDPEGTWDRVEQAVERAPLPARGGEAGPAELQTAAIASSYDGALATRMLEALAEADAGDGSGLLALAELYRSFSGYGPYLATMCADVEHPADPVAWAEMAERIGDAAARTGEATGNELLPCASIPGTEPPPPGAIAAPGAAPILVIGNTGDVATPADNARLVADSLESGVLLLHDGTGHTSFGESACVDDIVIAYLVDLVLPEPGARCEH